MELINDIKHLKVVVSESELCLLYVQAPDCGLCSIMLSKIEQVAERYPQARSLRAEIHVVPELAGEYLVATAPTVLIFSKGREIYRAGNFIDTVDLERFLSKWCENVIP